MKVAGGGERRQSRGSGRAARGSWAISVASFTLQVSGEGVGSGKETNLWDRKGTKRGSGAGLLFRMYRVLVNGQARGAPAVPASRPWGLTCGLMITGTYFQAGYLFSLLTVCKSR